MALINHGEEDSTGVSRGRREFHIQELQAMAVSSTVYVTTMHYTTSLE